MPDEIELKNLGEKKELLEKELKEINDLINKKINLGGKVFTISGILDTGFNPNSEDSSNKYKSLNSDTSSNDLASMVIRNQFNDEAKYGVNSLGFLNKGYFERTYLLSNYFFY